MHVLVTYDGSPASRRALSGAAGLADEHDAALTVVAQVAHERRRSCCGVSATWWNAELDRVVAEQLTEARAIVGDRARPTAFTVVEGLGKRALRRAAASMGCDRVYARPSAFSRRWKP